MSTENPSHGAMRCAEELHQRFGGCGALSLRQQVIKRKSVIIDRHVKPLVDALNQISDCCVDDTFAPPSRIATKLNYGDLRAVISALREWKEGK